MRTRFRTPCWMAGCLAVVSLLAAPMAQAQATLTPLLESGPTHARINVVVLSEGYTAAQLPAFLPAAQRIVDLGAQSVVIKGGHRRGPATDLFFDGKRFRQLRTPRIRTIHTHGTGCTLSAAIAAYLARGEKLESAIMHAKTYITAAIRKGFPVGSGHGPVHHFFRYWGK